MVDLRVNQDSGSVKEDEQSGQAVNSQNAFGSAVCYVTLEFVYPRLCLNAIECSITRMYHAFQAHLTAKRMKA
jgi:hypothetical protein